MSRAARRALFSRVAPRLEQAHRERRDELARERDARLRAAAAVLKAERLVAHRELQLARGEHRQVAAAGRSANQRRHRANYVALRDDKLQAARRELARARARAAELGL